MSATDNKRPYYNSMAALAYVDICHGKTLSKCQNHCILLFDFISTQEGGNTRIHSPPD